ncbi:unnamed protein product, partial [Allacma fusca]
KEKQERLENIIAINNLMTGEMLVA